MYRCLRPIYEALYGVLNKEFGPELKEFERGYHYETGTTVKPADYPRAFIEWGRVSDVVSLRSPENYEFDLTYRLFYFFYTSTKAVDIASQVFRPEDDSEGVAGIGDFAAEVAQFFWNQHYTGRFSTAYDFQPVYVNELEDFDFTLFSDDLLRNRPENITEPDDIRAWKQSEKDRIQEVFSEINSLWYQWQILDFSVDAGLVQLGSVSDATLLAIISLLTNNQSLRGLQLDFTFRVSESIDRQLFLDDFLGYYESLLEYRDAMGG